jgi:hypothetical protein
MFSGFQREDRLILKETKVWIEQFERDLTRAQMTESNLQDKYQVTYRKRDFDFSKVFRGKTYMPFNL